MLLADGSRPQTGGAIASRQRAGSPGSGEKLERVRVFCVLFCCSVLMQFVTQLAVRGRFSSAPYARWCDRWVAGVEGIVGWCYLSIYYLDVIGESEFYVIYTQPANGSHWSIGVTCTQGHHCLPYLRASKRAPGGAKLQYHCSHFCTCTRGGVNLLH